MTKKKYYYYVLVFTNSGPKYVTKIDNNTREAYWHEEDKPFHMTKDDAEFLAMGLTLNGNSSVMITSTYKIDNHPYNYKNYKIDFIKKEVKK